MHAGRLTYFQCRKTCSLEDTRRWHETSALRFYRSKAFGSITYWNHGFLVGTPAQHASKIEAIVHLGHSHRSDEKSVRTGWKFSQGDASWVVCTENLFETRAKSSGRNELQKPCSLFCGSGYKQRISYMIALHLKMLTLHFQWVPHVNQGRCVQ